MTIDAFEATKFCQGIAEGLQKNLKFAGLSTRLIKIIYGLRYDLALY